jgi:hypothetical protein
VGDTGGDAIVKSGLVAVWLALGATDVCADCPNTFTAKSGLPGRFGEWTTTYDVKKGTFEARHSSGNLITGNFKATCTDKTVVLVESNTSNNNDGTCELNRDAPKRFSGKCRPRDFDMRVTGF